jgi:ABC-type multidrug transport system fused ATPase/permease subunit
VTALVGTSGSGKSTAADLLLRVYDCEPQTILFDGHDIREFDLGSFRDRTFLVSQDPWILGRSLRDNLCFGLGTPPDDATLWALLGDVALADDVAALPLGLDTELGDRGGSFSPGQRQRVALARVLLRDVDLLVLDEATSALDSALEERVMVAIRRRLAGRTVVVIAHRFSTIRMADHVLVMEAGRIVESGPCEELASREGAFSQLFARQLEGLADGPAGVVVAPRVVT